MNNQIKPKGAKYTLYIESEILIRRGCFDKN